MGKNASHEKIARFHTGFPVTAGTTEGATAEIDYRNYAHGNYNIKPSDGVTTITWYGKGIGANDAYTPAYDYDGNAVTQTVVHTRGYPIPIALSGYAFIKPVASAGTASTLYFSLKG